MKKFTIWIIALLLALSVGTGALASVPSFDGANDFDVVTKITADTLTVRQNEPINFTAVTTFTSVWNDELWLQYVSDSWAGTDNSIPASETGVVVSAEPAADAEERQQVFTAGATVFLNNEPGEYVVRVTYSITLQHDSQGTRTYKTVTTTMCFPVDVLEGMTDTDTNNDGIVDAGTELPDGVGEGEAAPAPGTLLNYGQIVSAWAHWKQAKGNESFLSGGPGVYRSLNWYKTQLEDREFSTDQEVYDFLDSIYQPENLHIGVGNPNNDKDNPSDTNANPNSQKDMP